MPLLLTTGPSPESSNKVPDGGPGRRSPTPPLLFVIQCVDLLRTVCHNDRKNLWRLHSREEDGLARADTIAVAHGDWRRSALEPAPFS